MNRILLLGFGGLVLALGAVALWRVLEPDPTKIRRLVTNMARGFDDGSPNRAVAGLDAAWRDGESGIERELLRQGLIRFFFEEGRDTKTRELRYRVELPREELQVEIDPTDEKRARLSCRALFLERGEPEREVWSLGIEAELEKHEEGWRIVSTRRETLDGRRPGR